jgi:hypothetical protein
MRLLFWLRVYAAVYRTQRTLMGIVGGRWSRTRAALSAVPVVLKHHQEVDEFKKRQGCGDEG